MAGKLNNLYYVVSSMDRSQAFYQEALGLDIMFRDGDRWLQMSAGEGRIAFASAEEAAPEAAGAVAILEVPDIEAALTRISVAGGDISKIRDMGNHGKTAWFKDPDGNTLQLISR